MLVRGLEQRRQISLSMALGAPAARLVRRVLTECILLSLLGGAVGLVVALASTCLILHFAFSHFVGMAGVPITASLSIPVLFFALAVSLITGIAFGVAPAWIRRLGVWRKARHTARADEACRHWGVVGPNC
jgi:ABC-type antimicrobial peptide transport system permease subunit